MIKSKQLREKLLWKISWFGPQDYPVVWVYSHSLFIISTEKSDVFPHAKVKGNIN
jgi:hypothetical protein